MRRALLAALAAIALLAGPFDAVGSAQVSGARAEASFVSKINGLRAGKGLAPMEVHGELTDIGRSWAGVMAAAGRIWHNPDFSSQVTANWQKLGENVGMGGSVDSLFDAFVASPAHYRNLVDPAFTHVGVGVVVTGDGVIFTSHQFMKLAGASAPAPAPAPEPAPTTTAAPVVRPTTTTTARPRVTTTTAPPEPVPAPVAAPEPEPEPAPVAPPAPVRLAPRGVLVLDLLRALDAVR